MNDKLYRVEGMSCEHCQAAVQEALLAVPGVQAAEVDLTTATAKVASSQHVAEENLRQAVEEAGYRLVAV
ncbi:MAG: heavy-metal-associated domain-containing protein [Sulfobacillus sp.]